MAKTYDYMIGVDAIEVDAIKLVIDSTYKKQVRQVQKAVAGAAYACQLSTKRRCPVGTPASTGKKGYVGGTLKKSYQKVQSLDGLEAIVWTDTLYGKFVELGTYKMKAQPHLYPGFVDGSIWLMANMGVQL